jgi:DHA1 family bicyclomycin/chloramphenicol resistance-like MFS transporter
MRGTILNATSKSLVFFLAAQSALPALSIDSSLPALPAIGAELAASAAGLQWTLSAFLLGFAASQLVLGPLSDRYGRRPVLIGGLGLFILAGIGCSLSLSLPMLIAMRLLQGIGACAGSVISRAIVRDLFEGRLAAAKQSFLMAGSASAMLLGPAFGGFVSSLIGWRVAYAFLPLFGLALLGATVLFLDETRKATDATQARSALCAYMIFLHEPQARGFALFNALTFAGFFGYISGISPVVIGTFRIDPGLFGLMFAVAAITLMAGTTTGGIGAKRLPLSRMRWIGLAILLAALAVLWSTAESENLGLLFAGLGLYAFGIGMLMPNAIATAMAPRPDIAGAVSAAVGASQFALGACAGGLIGLYRPGTVFGMLAVMSLFTAASLIAAACLEGSARPAPIKDQPR